MRKNPPKSDLLKDIFPSTTEISLFNQRNKKIPKMGEFELSHIKNYLEYDKKPEIFFGKNQQMLK